MMLFLLCVCCFRWLFHGQFAIHADFLQVTKRRPRDSSIASVGREEAEMPKLSTTCHFLATFCTIPPCDLHYLLPLCPNASYRFKISVITSSDLTFHALISYSFYRHSLADSLALCQNVEEKYCKYDSMILLVLLFVFISYILYFLSITTPPTHQRTDNRVKTSSDHV